MPELIFKINPILANLDKIAVAQRIMELETPEIALSIENSKVVLILPYSQSSRGNGEGVMAAQSSGKSEKVRKFLKICVFAGCSRLTLYTNGVHNARFVNGL